MSTATHVGPRRRSELEVAAEAVMQVVDSGLLPKTPQVVANVAAATGIAVPELRAAWRRIGDHGYAPPRQRPVLALVEEPVRRNEQPVRRNEPANFRESLNRRRQAKEPTPGKRVCSTCGETKDRDEFYVKSGTKGTRDALCIPCRRQYQKDRYLLIGKAQALIELIEGDGCIGENCPKCGKAFEVGQRVKADRLAHEVCV